MPRGGDGMQSAMSAGAVALVAATLFVWGVVSGRLERADLSAPIVFVVVGVFLHAVIPFDTAVEAEAVKLLTEVTLAWVLFSDASAVRAAQLQSDVGVYLRLLGIALPVTVLLGWLVALGTFSGFDVWLALFVAAALAPTDASLGAAVMSNPVVPERVRGILNVESGLNDGIVTPVVIVALAGAAQAESHSGGGADHALVVLLIGAAIGVAVGGIGGQMLNTARRHGWVDEELAGPAVLALALLSYAAAVAGHGNGFVAAFSAGIAFGRFAGAAGRKEVWYVEETAGLASLVVWALFGAVAVPIVADNIDWRIALYAAESLTALRMLPVALVLAGTGVGRRTALFIGWFGPRGLASVVFGLIAVEELGPSADTAVATIATTVLLSVVVHGVTAGPLAARYAAAGMAEARGFEPRMGDEPKPH